MKIAVRDALSESDLLATRKVLAEYLSLQVDNYTDPKAVARAHQRELDALPGRYSPPLGRLFLGLANEVPAGCVALAEQSPGVGEMKRLYVREQFRGHGLGRALARATVDAGRPAGYSALRLDVHISRQPAIALYESLGFRRVKPWIETPFDLVFMELGL